MKIKAIARKNKKARNPQSNRIRIVIAIIFLFAIVAISRLYWLQIEKNGYYTALAASQHEISSPLEPDRGRIFLDDPKGNPENSLYPIAINRKFYSLALVPRAIRPEEAGAVALSLYESLDREHDEKEASALAGYGTASGTEEHDELTALKKEHETRLMKSEKLGEYEALLKKIDDPYVEIAKKFDEDTADMLKSKKIPGLVFNPENWRYYPEINLGTQLIGFYGFVSDEKKGRYGIEGFFNEELSGKKGFVRGEKDAGGRMITAAKMEMETPQNGCDVVLTIDRSIQYFACARLKEALKQFGADGGTVIAMDPSTGAIKAMCSAPDYDPNDYQSVQDLSLFNNPAIFEQYEPGSVFKPITMAAAINENKVAPGTKYKDEGSVMIKGWPKAIKNSDFSTHGGHGTVDMTTVLEYSLNTGAIFAMESIGSQKFAEYVKNFGFGEKTGIELETENPGDVRNLEKKEIKEINAATASFGQGISVTPLQMISSFTAIANEGVLMKPYIVSRIDCGPAGAVQTEPKELRRVISARTASLLSGMLVKVVEEGHAKRAQVKGYYVGGKTGTAQVPDKIHGGYSDKTMHTFVGFLPASDPRLVILTKLDHPSDAGWADGSTAPLFSEIANFAMSYMEVPAERK
jgi:stage V sporulation protein D (sporulation-specific penicillin-binding protein)